MRFLRGKMQVMILENEIGLTGEPENSLAPRPCIQSDLCRELECRQPEIENFVKEKRTSN
jgi:hypothetical protein